MTDYLTKPLSEFARDVTADGVIDTEEVAKIRERIFADGVIDRTEADFLFGINDAVSGKPNDPGWKELFVEALTAHVLGDAASTGVVATAESDYLMAKIRADATVDQVELALLANLMAAAKGTSEAFKQFVMGALKEAILEDGVIDAQEVELIGKVIYGSGSASGERIDRSEAQFLFELNDAVTGQNNHPAWESLFVEAIVKHALEDETSPGVIDEAEARWLVGRLEADGTIDETEKALAAAIKAKAASIAEPLRTKMEQWGV